MSRRPKKAYAARRLGRLSTAAIRALPDFMIIGAQKGGTTFLNRLLSQHPRVKPAFLKEVHYFDLNFDKGINWYRSNFPLRTSKGDRVVTGEASPYYLFHPHAARRAFAAVPNARLIVLLRNPVDRAYSHYQHQALRVQGEGRETLTFAEAIEAEDERLRGETERMLRDEHYLSSNHRNFSYLSRGLYVDQLMSWARYFDRTRMLVVRSEDLFGDTESVLETVSDFLEIPRWVPGKYSASNKGRYETAMEPDLRRRLDYYFKPHNLKLFEYLGVDFDW